MSDNKSASDDLSEEKEEATLLPRLSGNPHFLSNKYIKSLTHLHHFYTISETWHLITDAWYSSMKKRAKKRIRFPKRPDIMAKPVKLWARARWWQINTWAPESSPAFCHSSCCRQSKSTMLAPEVLTAQHLSDSVLFYERQEAGRTESQ